MRFHHEFEQYLILRFAGVTNEQGHVIYLGPDQRFLAGESEFFGNQRQVVFDIRRIVLRAITLGAECIVFAHNHPTGNPKPSEMDLNHLAYMERVLTPFDLTVLESFVVTSKTIISISNYRKRQEEIEKDKRYREYEEKSRIRKAKSAATRARKAAERKAAELEKV